MTVQVVNPKKNEPLGLPRGTVRAILTFAIVGGTLIIYVVKGDVPDWLISAFGTAFGFYFGTRGAQSAR